MLLRSRLNQFRVEDVMPMLNEYANKRQEHFIVLTFDSGSHLIDSHLVFLGTVNSTLCHPREVFAVAITDAASFIVLCHNHPSGDPYPSAEDKQSTMQLTEAGRILGIPVKDHLIIAKYGHFSMAKNKLLDKHF